MIFLTFKPLYVNRILNSGILSKKPNEDSQIECTFKPLLCKSNEKLQSHWRQKTASDGEGTSKFGSDSTQGFDKLMRTSKGTKTVAPSHEEQLYSECTFKPKINSKSKERPKSIDKCKQLYEKSRQKSIEKRRDITTEELEYMRSIEECTFRPNTSLSTRNHSKRQLQFESTINLGGRTGLMAAQLLSSIDSSDRQFISGTSSCW